RRHSVDRPSSRTASRWFGTSPAVRANQNAERPVSTRPLSGISVGRTTSKVEMRSLATSSSRSSSSAYSSRTLPLPTWVAASDMCRFLLLSETGESVERAVEVGNRRVQVEHLVERASVEQRADLGVLADERREVELFVPGPHRVALHEAVRVGAIRTCPHEREQEAVREEQ